MSALVELANQFIILALVPTVLHFLKGCKVSGSCNPTYLSFIFLCLFTNI